MSRTVWNPGLRTVRNMKVVVVLWQELVGTGISRRCEYPAFFTDQREDHPTEMRTDENRGTSKSSIWWGIQISIRWVSMVIHDMVIRWSIIWLSVIWWSIIFHIIVTHSYSPMTILGILLWFPRVFLGIPLSRCKRPGGLNQLGVPEPEMTFEDT